MDIKQFVSAIEQICEEKGISKEAVLETVEMSLAAAYKKETGRKGQLIYVRLEPETGKTKVFQAKIVVDESVIKSDDEVEEKGLEEKEKNSIEEQERIDGEIIKKIKFNPEKHIWKKEVLKLLKDKQTKILNKNFKPIKNSKEIKIGEEVCFPLKPLKDYGRLAAQTAKQVIIQRIREAERDAVYNEFKAKEGELVSGIVQRIEKGVIFCDIGRTSGLLFPEEQVARDNYYLGQRLKFYLVEVQKDSRGPKIILSRAHPKLVIRLFAIEVPEISNGTVEIKSIAREAGSRSKIAVFSEEEGVDPIGSCVGQKGTRVQAVINELNGEKIDIVEWSKDPVKFIANALSPAKVLDVEINKKRNEARIEVLEDQLSLAIGKDGQNVRLAAKLTGWKIDVRVPQKTKNKNEEKENLKSKPVESQIETKTADKKTKEKDKSEKEKTENNKDEKN